ncbi:MAG: hypothetical protein AAFS10_12340, partial [Myxococcota bacterium]
MNIYQILSILTCLSLVSLVAACGENSEPTNDSNDASNATEGMDPDVVSDATLTWSSAVRALVETQCTGCHVTGGSAPFVFETYGQVQAAAPAMLNAMESGRMPPWPADPGCRSYVGERVLADEDTMMFRTWVEGGMPEGEPTEPIAVRVMPFEATARSTANAPYTPDFGNQGDDYRCFVLDVEFPSATWVRGSTVEPDTQVVHHVLVYALDPQQAADAVRFDAESADEGYPCFGGPLPPSSSTGGGMMGSMGGGGIAEQVAIWVPGTLPNTLPDGMGVPVGAGDRLVMPVHRPPNCSESA